MIWRTCPIKQPCLVALVLDFVLYIAARTRLLLAQTLGRVTIQGHSITQPRMVVIARLFADFDGCEADDVTNTPRVNLGVYSSRKRPMKMAGQRKVHSNGSSQFDSHGSGEGWGRLQEHPGRRQRATRSRPIWMSPRPSFSYGRRRCAVATLDQTAYIRWSNRGCIAWFNIILVLTILFVLQYQNNYN